MTNDILWNTSQFLQIFILKFENIIHKNSVLFALAEHKLSLGPTEPWSVREKLCLASSVMKSGDQNWYINIVVAMCNVAMYCMYIACMLHLNKVMF